MLQKRIFSCYAMKSLQTVKLSRLERRRCSWRAINLIQSRWQAYRGINVCSTLQVKEVTKMLSNQVEACGKVDIMCRQDRINGLSSAGSTRIVTKYIWTCYKEVEKQVIRSRYSNNVRIENSDRNTVSFVRIIPLFSDQMATTLKSTA